MILLQIVSNTTSITVIDHGRTIWCPINTITITTINNNKKKWIEATGNTIYNFLAVPPSHLGLWDYLPWDNFIENELLTRIISYINYISIFLLLHLLT
jgi:hypothetical protein